MILGHGESPKGCWWIGSLPDLILMLKFFTCIACYSIFILILSCTIIKTHSMENTYLLTYMQLVLFPNKILFHIIHQSYILEKVDTMHQAASVLWHSSDLVWKDFFRFYIFSFSSLIKTFSYFTSFKEPNMLKRWSLK